MQLNMKPSKSSHKTISVPSALGQSISNTSGAVLLTVVVIIIIIGLAGVAIYSLTYTSTFTQLQSQKATKAYYIAESGVRMVAGEYNDPSVNKNGILEYLHGKTLTLPENAGQFDVRLYPTWFYVTQDYSPGGSPDTIRVKIPGGVPRQDPTDPNSAKISIPDSCELKLQGKTQHATIISKSPLSPDDDSVIIFTLNPGFPFSINEDDELFLVYSDTISPSTVSLNSDLILNGSNDVASMLPAKNGSFRIDNYNNEKLDYTYKEAVFTEGTPPTITLTDIDHQNPANPSENQFTVDTDTQLFVGKNLTIVSNASVGEGLLAGNNTVVNYTDVGLDGGFSGGKDTISFEDDIADFSPTMGNADGPLAPSDPQPILVDVANNQIELGRNLPDHYGSVWYKGDSDIANCIQGKCNLGKGFRAFFELTFNDTDNDLGSGSYGEGFTFSLISGVEEEENPGSYRNTAADTGGGESGEYLGYAGPGLDDGLQPPKLAIEFDTYPSPGAGDICAGNSRRDHTPGANHLAAVYWGEETPGSFDAKGGYLSLGSADWASHQGTITFWFKRDSINDGNGSTTGNRLWGQNGNMEMRFSSDGEDLFLDWGVSAALSAYGHPFTEVDTWYFIAITWNDTNGHLDLYWGSEAIAPQSLASTVNWPSPSSVTGVGVNENLFMNSGGGTFGTKQFQVDGKAAELRYYNVALDTANLNQINSIYTSRDSVINPQAYFPLQTDLVNIGSSTIAATTVGSTGWFSDTPSLYPYCSLAPAETYDDNRHGAGGITTPMNSLEGNPPPEDGKSKDAYYPKVKVDGEPNWLEDGDPHLFRMELLRPPIDDPEGSEVYKYQFKVWVLEREDLSDDDFADFKNVRADFSAWDPLIEKSIDNGNPLNINQKAHDELKRVLFGFTEGTGGVDQNITLKFFELYFLKRYPVSNLAEW